MNVIRIFANSLLLGLTCFTISVIGQEVDFQRDVRPILSDKCFFCHGPDPKTREAGLRLDIESLAKEDLGGYFAIVAGDTENSELISRIDSDDEDEVMPPAESEKHLTAKEKEILKRWIKQGAKWAKHWAYEKSDQQPFAKTEKNTDPRWTTHPIDKHTIVGITKAGLKPAKSADRTTLIRRLYFDLTGLPPTPDQVKAFLEDKSPDAYEKLAKRLLNSSHYGERMAIFWLDLVRYADTVGYHGDQDHNIAPYRDWVIHAFNEDMKFDQFTREQLAGDLLEKPTQSQLIATGYNRLLQTTHEGGLQPKEYRAIYAADRVRNVSVVWMGATVGCAQCHDHKYDPYTAKDFYSLAAFFADVDDERHFKVGTNSLPTARPPELELPTKEQTAQIGALNKKIKSGKLNKKQLANTKKQLAQIRKQVRRTMITVALKKPRTVRVLPRGNWLDETGPVVQPAIPEFFGKLSASKRPTRLDLANWLVGDSKNSNRFFTSRVMVNRVWAMLLGHGISRDLADFGGQGSPPSNSALLDYLAHQWIADKMSFKKLIYHIVTSNTYKQSSRVTADQHRLDPTNQTFSHQSRYRLPAELIRDQALLISGLLNDKIGGISAKPYQPAGHYRHLNFPPRKYRHSGDANQWRRGVYVHWQRQFLHPTLRALDAPTREECTAERTRSNTPLAALSLLNDPSFVEAARNFAQRIIQNKTNKTDQDKIVEAFQWATLRKPTQSESKILTQLLQSNRERYRQNADDAKKLIQIGQSKYDKSIPASELAAWTGVARALLNLSETITRN